MRFGRLLRSPPGMGVHDGRSSITAGLGGQCGGGGAREQRLLSSPTLVEIQRGSLNDALRIAERSVASAEQARAHDLEAAGVACMGFVNFWRGEFRRVAWCVDQGISASERGGERSMAEARMLLLGLAGAVAGRRGDMESTASAFDEGLREASAHGHRDLEGALRLLRAETTVAFDAPRALGDAQQALAAFDAKKAPWWAQWARRCMAAAHLALGDVEAAIHHGDATLAGQQGDLDGGLTRTVRGHALLQAGRTADASADLAEAVTLLERTGTPFGAAQAEVLMAQVDSRRASYLLRSADRRANGNRGDTAWVSMLRGPGSLRIQVLGGFEVVVDGVPVNFKTRGEAEAVAMLVESAPAGRSADLIADRLWPGASAAQSAHRIDNLLSSLRRSLLPTTRLRRDRGVVSLDIDADECDLLAARRDAVGDAAQRSNAADLLRRPFLGDTAPDWALEVQDDLFRLRMGLLGAVD